MIDNLSDDIIIVIISHLKININLSCLETNYTMQDYINYYSCFSVLKNKLDNISGKIEENMSLYNLYRTCIYFKDLKKELIIKIINYKNPISNIISKYPILLQKKDKILTNLKQINRELTKYIKIKESNNKDLGIYFQSDNFSLHFNTSFSIIELVYLLSYLCSNNIECIDICCSGNGLIIGEFKPGVWL